MSALAEALVAAQRRALASLEKAFVADRIDSEALHLQLHAMGITDDIDISYLATSLAVIREWGSSAPAETNGASEPKATQAQVKYAQSLLQRLGAPALAEQDLRAMTPERISKLIGALKDGSYQPGDWDVPF